MADSFSLFSSRKWVIEQSYPMKKMSQIQILYETGHSNKEISKMVKRSCKVTRNLLCNLIRYGTRKLSGRTRLLTAIDECHSYQPSSVQLYDVHQSPSWREFGLSVSRMAVWRDICWNPNIVRQTVKQAPRLLQYNWDKRLNFYQIEYGHRLE